MRAIHTCVCCLLFLFQLMLKCRVSDTNGIQELKPDPDPGSRPFYEKFSIDYMIILNKKLLPFSFFDGP